MRKRNGFNMMLPDFADRVRLERAAVELGCKPEEVAARLIHDFFCGRGVKNPLRGSALRNGVAVSAASRV